jgi:AcrR family transcriptional regulator
MSAATARRTRQSLVAAAGELIEGGGYAAASVAAIAQRAGVSAGALYRHYPSKAELFVEVFRAAAERELAAMHEAATKSGTFAPRFDAVIATYARSALANRRLAWALVYEPVEEIVDVERLAYRRRYREGMAELLRAGIAERAIPEQRVALTSAAVVGAIAEALVGPLSPVGDESVTDAELVADLVRLCRRAVGLDRDPYA